MNARIYLRGLTPGRVGLVVLVCAILTARQLASCHPYRCAPLGNETLLDSTVWQVVAGAALFLGRSVFWALPMLFAVTIADNATVRARRGVRVGALAAAVLFGAVVYGLGFWYTQPAAVQALTAGQFVQAWPRILGHFSRAALYGGLATAILYFFARERADAQAAHQSKLSKLVLDRQTVEARLQALQAQIEPHFLFNTLANIKLLYEFESVKARTLVRDLAVYLRIALPHMRASRTTLAHELDMARAYLRVIETRMGDRLRVEIDAPDDLCQCALPPMMLSTLVENAIKHGLNPLPRGGTLSIRASRDAASLRIDVVDNGVGFHGRFGSGVGLSNTRARLAALYGTAGHLTLNTNSKGGVTATIELPYTAVATEGAA